MEIGSYYHKDTMVDEPYKLKNVNLDDPKAEKILPPGKRIGLMCAQ
jgi:hypothetical protein